MASSGKLSLLAVDGGPREALGPLAAACAGALEDVGHPGAERESYWRDAFRARAPGVLVVGTSDSTRGRAVESSARCAARRVGLSIAAIEDFPGNYYDVPDGGADLAIVESDFSRILNIEKFGRRCPRIATIPPARYDPYREQYVELRRATAERWAEHTAEQTRVLWAGQPETADALRTLRAVLPRLRDLNAVVLFKSHPRDPGHGAGVYPPVFASAGVAYRDVTDRSVTQALRLAPKLVLTQFSSVAIEAGFYGVPSVHVLLAEAGGERLLQKKGYAVPPLCLAGGAACVTDEREIGPALDRALRDAEFRTAIIDCFDAYFGSGERALPKLLEVLDAFAATCK